MWRDRLSAAGGGSRGRRDDFCLTCSSRQDHEFGMAKLALTPHRRHEVSGLYSDTGWIQQQTIVRLVHLRILALDRIQRGLGTQSLHHILPSAYLHDIGTWRSPYPKIRSTIPLRQPRQLIQKVRLEGRLPLPRVDADDLPPGFLVRQGEVEFSIESTGSAESGVHGVGSVCCADDDNLTCLSK